MHSAVSADTFLRELALAVARNEAGANEPLPVVLAQEGITQAEYTAVLNNPLYTRHLEAFRKELRESGFTFTAKCRVLAEDLLPNLYHIAKDDDQPAAARVKAIENLVSWADLKPKDTTVIGAGAGFSISITVNGDTTTINAGNAQLETVTEVPVVEIPAIPAPEHEVGTYVPTKIVLFEPETYQYAGDEVFDAP